MPKIHPASAFIKGYQSVALLSGRQVGPMGAMASESFTQLNASKLLEPAAQSLCRGFFDGFKTPSILIAGTSFTALFALGKTVKDSGYMSKRDVLCMKLYHMCSLMSFCLSLTTVLSGQAATTMLLSPQPVATKAAAFDAYQFLRANMNVEFLLTRWSFTTSIVFFLQTTCFRLILEFDLFSERARRTAGVMVVSLTTGIALAMLSYINSSHVSHWPSVWEMTKELAVVRRNDQKPSVLCTMPH